MILLVGYQVSDAHFRYLLQIHKAGFLMTWLMLLIICMCFRDKMRYILRLWITVALMPFCTKGGVLFTRQKGLYPSFYDDGNDPGDDEIGWFLTEISRSKQPLGLPRFAASHLGGFTICMSQKYDTRRLIFYGGIDTCLCLFKAALYIELSLMSYF